MGSYFLFVFFAVAAMCVLVFVGNKEISNGETQSMTTIEMERVQIKTVEKIQSFLLSESVDKNIPVVDHKSDSSSVLLVANLPTDLQTATTEIIDFKRSNKMNQPDDVVKVPINTESVMMKNTKVVSSDVGISVELNTTTHNTDAVDVINELNQSTTSINDVTTPAVSEVLPMESDNTKRSDKMEQLEAATTTTDDVVKLPITTLVDVPHADVLDNSSMTEMMTPVVDSAVERTTATSVTADVTTDSMKVVNVTQPLTTTTTTTTTNSTIDVVENTSNAQLITQTHRQTTTALSNDVTSVSSPHVSPPLASGKLLALPPKSKRKKAKVQTTIMKMSMINTEKPPKIPERADMTWGGKSKYRQGQHRNRRSLEANETLGPWTPLSVIVKQNDSQRGNGTGTWPSQLSWPKPCHLAYSTALKGGWLDLHVAGSKSGESIRSLRFAEVSKSCFAEDDTLLTCSCCDGLMLCPTTYRFPGIFNKEMIGSMTRPFSAALTNGSFRSLSWNTKPIPVQSITVSGIDFIHEKVQDKQQCDYFEPKPTLIIRNGWAQRITSTENFAHWLGELWGVIIHALQIHNIERIVPLIPHCSSLKIERGKSYTFDYGWKYTCIPTPLRYYSDPRPHYGSSEMRGDWWFQFAIERGIPFLDDVISQPTNNFDAEGKTVCFEKLIMACPPPRLSPISKYTNTISPLVRYWMNRNWNFDFSRPSKGILKRLAIVNRRPGGTRYLANANELMRAAYIHGGWEPTEFEYWNGQKTFLEYATLLQNTAVLVGIFGGDLSLQLFMRSRSVVVEVSLWHSSQNDPFYVFQSIGSGIHAVRWFVKLSAIKELSHIKSNSEWLIGNTQTSNPWIRKVLNMTLPLSGFLSTLDIAEKLLAL